MKEHKEELIERFTFGEFIIAGKKHSSEKGVGKDIRLVGREVSAWKERKGHRLTPEMITGVYGQGIEVLVIGNGESGALEVPAEVIAAIQANGIPEVIVEKTGKACQVYNRLYRKGKKAALLAHGTC